MSLSIFSIALSLTACAPKAVVHTMKVDGGGYKVKASHNSENTAREAAIEGAKKECQSIGKTAVFKNEDRKYKGTFDEKTDKTIEKVGRVGAILGSTDAAVIGQGMSQDNEYSISYDFVCE